MTPDSLDVVAAYNNELRWESRLTNFRRFENGMVAAGVRLTTVELQPGERPWELSDREGVRRVRVRSDDMLWRKENLQRLGFEAIPDWRYGVAMDGDMLLHDPNWPAKVLHALQSYAMVQVSSDIVWLGPDDQFVGQAKSLMHHYAVSRRVHLEGHFWHPAGPVEMLDFGYPGCAWAYRRQTYEEMGGLLDLCILGAGDYHMAYALLGLEDKLLNDNDYTVSYRDAIKAWKAKAREAVQEDIGLVPMMMFHLWHGSLAARRYSSREQILIRNHYDPLVDVRRDRQGVLHLAGNKPRLRDDIRAYFSERDEDSNDWRPKPKRPDPPRPEPPHHPSHPHPVRRV